MYLDSIWGTYVFEGVVYVSYCTLTGMTAPGPRCSNYLRSLLVLSQVLPSADTMADMYIMAVEVILLLLLFVYITAVEVILLLLLLFVLTCVNDSYLHNMYVHAYLL